MTEVNVQKKPSKAGNNYKLVVPVSSAAGVTTPVYIALIPETAYLVSTMMQTRFEAYLLLEHVSGGGDVECVAPFGYAFRFLCEAARTRIMERMREAQIKTKQIKQNQVQEEAPPVDL